MSAITNITSVLSKDFPKLTGQDNYIEWYQEFCNIARLNGVYEYYLPSSDPNHVRGATKPALPALKDMVTRSTAAEIDSKVTIYKLELDEWRDSDKRVRLAQAILQASVQPYIWDEVAKNSEAVTAPHSAIALIINSNKPSRAVQA